ncbi:MAG: 7-cyano-7-deazaguanine synthase QueC [Phycisphaeraceae bacterium]|nr:7-cyano-7-deazaguanine synthase QueC [Phycisphaerales bacterium]MCB9842575.1 7-cyano-7-deazaguanine synthase QueC [Phycisphaeraceae bacterium]
MTHNPPNQTQSNTPRAVVLLSGGLDSATCLAIAQSHGYACHCLSFDYHQRHANELAAADRVAAHHNAASHRVATIDLRAFGGSALTDDHIAVPKSDDPFQGDAGDIPVTYVPARNTIFLSYALALAEVLDAKAIYIGVNAVDYSGYPDCRPDFINAFQRMADLATRAGVEGHGPRIESPLSGMTKPDIIRLGLKLGVDYALTHSCYDPSNTGTPCARCDSCRIRKAAFAQLGMQDPALTG